LKVLNFFGHLGEQCVALDIETLLGFVQYGTSVSRMRHLQKARNVPEIVVTEKSQEVFGNYEFLGLFQDLTLEVLVFDVSNLSTPEPKRRDFLLEKMAVASIVLAFQYVVLQSHASTQWKVGLWVLGKRLKAFWTVSRHEICDQRVPTLPFHCRYYLLGFDQDVK
jgi:hypothetical protein